MCLQTLHFRTYVLRRAIEGACAPPKDENHVREEPLDSINEVRVALVFLQSS